MAAEKASNTCRRPLFRTCFHALDDLQLTSSSAPPHRYLVICNISKAANIKALIAAAAAHRFVPILVASDHLSEAECMMLKPSRAGGIPADGHEDAKKDEGKGKHDRSGCNSSGTSTSSTNSSGTQVMEDVEVYRVATMNALVAFLTTHAVPLVGIEILDDAKSVSADDAFTSTKLALMPGNEGTGLAAAHKARCSHHVYIPHYGVGGTGSLNVSIAATIVLAKFCEWAGTM
jgi:tRNA G18 (ribose-2'-O)-methylase SpoU